MIGTLINCGAIILGSLIGLLFRKGMNPRLSKVVMQGMGLSVVLIGISGAIKTNDTLLVIVSMAVGGVIGALIDIDAKMNSLGLWAQNKLSHGKEGENTFAQGFVSASLVYCIGAMAVVGALDSGIRADHSTLIAKALIDGVTSIVFASSLGIGVMASAVPVLVYQGTIALLGTLVSPLLGDAVINEMGAVGGLLITGIGINMLLEKDIKVANLLPAIFVPFVYYTVINLF